MRNFLLGVVAVIIVGVIGFTAYQLGRQNTQTPQTSQQITPTQEMVGNDRDEHGCIGSAGYTWCEGKKKCLRSWEEECSVKSDAELIKEALIKKNNWGADLTFSVNVSTNDGKYASGTVSSDGGGGYFFAVKSGNSWEIVADGNGVILCSNLENYPDFPTTLIPECFDEQTGKNVTR